MEDPNVSYRVEDALTGLDLLDGPVSSAEVAINTARLLALTSRERVRVVKMTGTDRTADLVVYTAETGIEPRASE